MKTLIVYATKHGAAGEVAQRIAARIKGAEVRDLGKGNISPADYDCVIIGASVYAGSIRKEAKAFVSQNAAVLRERKLGLFISGMETKNEKTYFEANFPADILEKAKAASLLGGIFDPKKASAMDRLIMRLVAKKKLSYINTIDDSKIEQFAKTMQA